MLPLPPLLQIIQLRNHRMPFCLFWRHKNLNLSPILPYAAVKVQISANRYVLARTLTDGCSQTNLVTESFVRRHRLTKTPANTNITGVGPVVSSSRAVELTISSQYSDYTLTFTADVIGHLPYKITPETHKTISQLDPALKLADTGVESAQFNILISTKFSNRFLSGQKKFFGEICFESSKLG